MRNIYEPGDAEFDEFEVITLRNSVLEEVIKELISASLIRCIPLKNFKMGWGHGSYQSCIEMADPSCREDYSDAPRTNSN